jgi:uncharacterized protein
VTGMTDQVVDFRPHHLPCVLTHIGRGYSPEFVANYAHVIESLNKGASIRIVDGPDHRCAGFGCVIKEQGHCRSPVTAERDRRAAADIERTFGWKLTAGSFLRPTDHEWKLLRTHFAKGTIRSACEMCTWRSLCTSIARRGFPDVKLKPAQVPAP